MYAVCEEIGDFRVNIFMSSESHDCLGAKTLELRDWNGHLYTCYLQHVDFISAAPSWCAQKLSVSGVDELEGLGVGCKVFN